MLLDLLCHDNDMYLFFSVEKHVGVMHDKIKQNGDEEAHFDFVGSPRAMLLNKKIFFIDSKEVILLQRAYNIFLK